MFSKPLQYWKLCLLFSFLFSHDNRVQESWKEEREIWQAENSASYLVSFLPHDNRVQESWKEEREIWQAENSAYYLVSFFPHDNRVQESWKEEREIWQAFHFFKTFTVQKTLPHI